MAVGDLEAERAHDLPVLADQGARPAVDLAEVELVLVALGEPHQPEHEAGDLRTAVQRGLAGGRLAAAVAGRDRVLGQQLDEPVEVALADRLEEAPGQRLALLPRGLEARPAGLDVTARADGELASVLARLADDLGDRVVAVVEDVVEEEDRPLDRAQGLQRDQQRHRDRLVVGP